MEIFDRFFKSYADKPGPTLGFFFDQKNFFYNWGRVFSTTFYCSKWFENLHIADIV